MKRIKSLEHIPFPAGSEADNFTFDCMTEGGTFAFRFRFFGDRWHCWVTLPSGEVREVGVFPNAITGTGNTDYGFVFETNLPVIGKTALPFTELYLLTWA